MINPYNLFKKVAFRLDAEWVHERTITLAHQCPDVLSKIFNQSKNDPRLSLRVAGMDFSFPVGLAAGLDKNAEACGFFSKLHFGFVELGTVTPLAQSGNDRPRLFRYPEIESLRNRMGFNNHGMDSVYNNLLNANRNGKIIGANLGKNKITEQKNAKEDYRKLYQKFAPIVDYLVINVSSPNTPGLRNLQSISELKEIFEHLKEERVKLSKPLFLKISPDINPDDINEILNLCSDYKLTGIIATNTTIIAEKGEGGFSGKILTEKSKMIRNQVLNLIKENSYPLVLIGVGGISSFDDVWDFWKNGGKLLQVYTGFIFQGPSILSDINSKIIETIEYNGYKNLEELLTNISSAKLKK